MTAEENLLNALCSVLPHSSHLALNGEPDAAAVYRYLSTGIIYESDVPILARDSFEINIYQHEHSTETVLAVMTALRTAGFTVTAGAQSMVSLTEEGYSVDNLTATTPYHGMSANND